MFEELEVRDVGGGLIIHTFGAFYGVTISTFLNNKFALEAKNLYGTRNSFRMGMVGTLFLWCFWPSFNGALAADSAHLFLSYINTYFSLIGSVFGTYIFCVIHFDGKYSMDQILNSTLAGGVVMGVGADILGDSYVAFIVGFFIGIISSLMFEKMPKFLIKYKL